MKDYKAEVEAYKKVFVCVTQEFYDYYDKLVNDIEKCNNDATKKLLLEHKEGIDKAMAILEL